MNGDSRLNVYIIGADLPPRLRQRLQAQVQSALRSLPLRAFRPLERRIADLGVIGLPLVVEPRPADDPDPRAVSFGRIDGRPAAYLLPRIEGGDIRWRQDRRYLLAKAVGYLAAPDRDDSGFWRGWSEAVRSDRLRERAGEIGEPWTRASDLDLLLELFAAWALSPTHPRWGELPAARRFLDRWADPEPRPAAP